MEAKVAKVTPNAPPMVPNWSKVAPSAPQDADVEPKWCQNPPHGSQNGAQFKVLVHLFVRFVLCLSPLVALLVEF